MRTKGVIIKQDGRYEIHSLDSEGKTAFIIRFDELKTKTVILTESGFQKTSNNEKQPCPECGFKFDKPIPYQQPWHAKICSTCGYPQRSELI